LQNIRVVMVEPTHPGNIGAAARAIKNMGLCDLRLVNPPVGFPCSVALARASGAADILHSAVVCTSLEEALCGTELVFGTSARPRSLDWECQNPRAAAELILKQGLNSAVVFGRESSGLSNEELIRCHYHIQIPTVSDFSSINLSQAIQVITYELRAAFLSASVVSEPPKLSPEDLPATAENVYGFYDHLEETLGQLGIVRSRSLVSRLQLMFNRTKLKEVEVNILRGFLSAVQKKLHLTSSRESK
jgi:tRNA (cytidine32/uridine32-2'-O)-methyltransferase